ncbi:MAG: regulatory protein RecX [Lentisphaerae bacterium]|nr:regulatory protein RecX [Lentisphaerota bacterium]
MQENNSEYPQKRVRRKDVSAWEQTLRWLDIKWYSESKLREKLNSRHYPVAEIEEAIARCREYNLINDAMLAEEFAKSQSARGRGSRRIAHELYRHGLTGDAAKNALEQIEGNDESSAQAALQSKLSTYQREPDWRKRREKAFRFLANRGYPLDIIYSTLDNEPDLNMPD